MDRIIYDVRVNYDDKLLEEEVINIVAAERRMWEWEGKKLGRVDLVLEDAVINLYSYEKTIAKKVKRRF